MALGRFRRRWTAVNKADYTMKTIKPSHALSIAELVLLILTAAVACQPVNPLLPTVTPTGASISGAILNSDGSPLPGAMVRVKATSQVITTGADGKFTFSNMEAGQPVLITAYVPGYYIGGGKDEIQPGASDVEIVLIKHADEDNPDYGWLSAFAKEGKEGNCENCHSTLTPYPSPKGRGESLPFDEWSQDAHANSALNPRFLTMYTGIDVDGNQSPQTRYGYSRDYGSFPLRPDPGQPYYGPGYKLDFPNTAGNCAACHTPTAAIDEAYGTNPTSVVGVGAEGVTCDFCHKVWSVRLASNGLPQPNMPGVLSYEFRRPLEGHQFFAGPLDDVAPGEDTFTPIQTQSQYCAPCHFGTFWDTKIYNSFGEWLESPYSDVERAKTAGLSSSKSCQDCHMPSGQSDHFARLDKGGALRDPATIFSHLMPGASDTELLQNAVTMTVDAIIEDNQVIVEVKITNDKTGHHVPTDSPLRQMILLVNATDGQGQVLPLLIGEKIPEWGGVGDPSKGYFAGLPGKGYAKILMELWTEISPSGAYWNPTRIVSDNRIPAFESDTSTYTFTVPSDGKVNVKISLLFRRAFKELMDQKDWDVPDIVMEEEILTLP